MNLATIIILALLSAAVYFAIRTMRRGRRGCCNTDGSCGRRCDKECNGCCR